MNVWGARQSRLGSSCSFLPLYICPFYDFGQGEKIGQDKFGKFVQFSRLGFCEFVVGRVISFEPDMVRPVRQILRERGIFGEFLYPLRKCSFGLRELVFQSRLQRLSEHHSSSVKASPKAVYSLPEIAFNAFGQMIRDSRFRFGVNLDNFVVFCRSTHPLLALRTGIKICSIGMFGDAIPQDTVSSGVDMVASQYEGCFFDSAVRTIDFYYAGDHCLNHSCSDEKGNTGSRVLRAQLRRAGRVG